MAIKPISKLDPYQNGATDTPGAVGGNFHLYEIINSKDQNAILTDPKSNTKDQLTVTFEENDFYNLLFEVSKPIDTGSQGINSNEYSSYKLTYEDLIQNVIIDTKQWLNARNNLGDFDLCALAYRNYIFGGDKIFDGNVDITKTLDVTGNTSIGGTLNVTGDATFDSKVFVKNDLSCGANVYVWNNLSAGGALYTATLSSDSNGTTIDPGRNRFVVKNVLTGKADPTGYFNVQVPTNITSNTSINGTLNVSQRITGNNGLTINAGGVTFNCDLEMGSHSITAGVCELTANHAKWSDLAEYYLGDAKYDPGTLIKFGGKNEITIANSKEGEVNGVVTTKPAFLMNSNLKDNPFSCAIALVGRVPVKIIGKVKKFDLIVLSKYDGIGEIIRKDDLKQKKSNVIGRALETNDNENIKLVECVVNLKL